MKIDLNLTYLKYFYDAALMGSVSESARRNFVSQSAVSQAIAKLEKALGVLLCMHMKQQFKLTPEGEIVFEKAKGIFSAVRQLHDALDVELEQPKMPLNFVTTHSIGLSILPDFLIKFREKYPEVEVNFQFGGITQIKGWLKQGIAEFALLLESPHLSGYSQKVLYGGSFGLYKYKKEKRDLEAVGVYVEHKEGAMVAEFQAVYRLQHGQEIAIRAEMNSWEFIARSLESGSGYGLMPDFITMHGRYPGLVEVLAPTLPYILVAAYPKGEVLSFSAETFLSELESSFSKSV